MSLQKPLDSYEKFKSIIESIRSYWFATKYFYSGYFFIYLRLNESRDLIK